MIRNLIANFLFWLLMASIVSIYAFIGFKIAGLDWSFFWIFAPFAVLVGSFYLICRFYRDIFVAEATEETGTEF